MPLLMQEPLSVAPWMLGCQGLTRHVLNLGPSEWAPGKVEKVVLSEKGFYVAGLLSLLFLLILPEAYFLKGTFSVFSVFY